MAFLMLLANTYRLFKGVWVGVGPSANIKSSVLNWAYQYHKGVNKI